MLKYKCRKCGDLTIHEFHLARDAQVRCLKCEAKIRITGKPDVEPIFSVELTPKVSVKVVRGKLTRHK